jgi:hypothetical protein
MKHSESLKAIAPALRRVQGAIHGVVPNQKNPFFKSEYADLGACWGAVKGALQGEGISLVQTMGFIPTAGPTLITTLLHESGEFISGEQPVCAKGDDPQAMGSAISYARRYGLSAIVSLVEIDDDGEKAMARPLPKGELPREDDIPPFPAPTPIRPSAPSPSPSGLEAAVCPFGSNAGKPFAEVGKPALAKDRAYWLGRLREKNEEPSGRLKKYLEEINAYLGQSS